MLDLKWRKTGRETRTKHSEPVELARTDEKSRRFYRVRAHQLEVARYDP